jgi:hypothetical protein
VEHKGWWFGGIIIQMVRVLFLILGLLSIGLGVEEGENMQGTLLIKQNKAD